MTLLSLTGASGVGTSTALTASTRVFGARPVTCAEFDSIGVPPGADAAWRHDAAEQWVRRALDEQGAGRHMLLCGQVPVGELLTAPSATELDCIAVCLLHCSPAVRRERLIVRGEDPNGLADHLAFGEWFLRHTLDPEYLPEVMRVPSTAPMRWERWAKWTADDPRWSFEVIDTDGLTPENMADHVVVWAREALAGQRLTLAPGWADPQG